MLDDEDEDVRHMTDPSEFDKEIEMASRGEWEALGLSPDAPDDKFEQVSVDDFMSGA